MAKMARHGYTVSCYKLMLYDSDNSVLEVSDSDDEDSGENDFIDDDDEDSDDEEARSEFKALLHKMHGWPNGWLIRVAAS